MAQTQGLEKSKTLGEQSREENEEDNNKTVRPEVDPAEFFKHLDSNTDGHLDIKEVSIYQTSGYYFSRALIGYSNSG